MFERARNTRIGAAVIVVAMLVTHDPRAARAGQEGKAVYEKNCVSCHGASGMGDGPVGKVLKPPPGDFATALRNVNDDDVTKLIKDGGKPMGKTHPAFGKKLSDEQLTALTTYLNELAGK